MTGVAGLLRLNPPRRPLTRLLALTLGIGMSLAALYVILILSAERLLIVKPGGAATLAAADALVVLGGDPETRAPLAADLYRKGVAPVVVVSGDGDCGDAAQTLAADGVPPAAIRIECLSGSTAENAAFSVSLMRREGVRRAVVVTSWFHTRRARSCFSAAAPDMAIAVAGTAPPPVAELLFFTEATSHVIQEYVKLAWYGFGLRCAAPVPGGNRR